MSFWFDKAEAPDVAPAQPAPYHGIDIGLFEGVEATYRTTRRAENGAAYEYLLEEKLQPIVEVIEERTGAKFINPARWAGASSSMGHMERRRDAEFQKLIGEIKSKPDVYPEYQDLTMEKINEEIKQTALEELKRGENISQRLTAMGEVGAIIGTIGGSLVDGDFVDSFIMTGPLSVASLGRNLLQRIFYNSAISAGQEAILQPKVKKWYESLGIDYGWDDAFTQIAAAGAFGGALPVAGKAFSLTTEQIRKGVKAYQDSNLISKQDGELIKAIADDADVIATRPDPGVSSVDHLVKVEEAMGDIQAGRLPGLDEPENARVSTPTVLTPEEEAVGAQPKIDPNTGIEMEELSVLQERFEALPDDAIIDETVEGVEVTAGPLKAALRQDDAMMERLRGCVIR